MSKQSVTDTLEPTVSLHVEVCRVRASTSPLSFTYDANERLSRIRAPGLDTAYDYFENGLTKSITTTKAGSTDPVASFTYDYDKGDMPSSQTSYIESNPAATQTTYAYDKAARLIGASSNLEALSYSYDASGNMASKTQGAQTTTYSYNSANQLQADSEENSYTYDPTGNLTSITGGTRPATSYTYDSEGRMTGAAVGQAQASYSYDPLGRMAMRTQGSASELFISRGTGYDPLSITGSSGMTSYLSSPDGSAKLASVSGEGTFNTLGTDIHGDVVFSADATGAITGSSLYSPYGVKSLSSGSQGALGFQGQYTDSLTGLVGMGLRNYDPTLGRFQTPDPKAPETVDPMSYDTYAYANDAPVARVDLMGTSSQEGHYDWWNPWDWGRWVYDNAIQPIGEFIVDIGRAAYEVARATYQKAVNAVKAIARTTRNIGAKIGRAMRTAVKTAGRMFKAGLREARDIARKASTINSGIPGMGPVAWIGILVVVIIVTAVVATVAELLIKDASPTPDAAKLREIIIRRGSNSLEQLISHYDSMGADWQDRFVRTRELETRILEQLSNPQMALPTEAQKKRLQEDIDRYARDREWLFKAAGENDPVRMNKALR
jgi:RHS repeat-associated protein